MSTVRPRPETTFEVDVDDETVAAFHHPRTLHHTPPNRTDRSRRAFATEFQTTPTPREVPAERPWIDEGKEAWAKRSPADLR